MTLIYLERFKTIYVHKILNWLQITKIRTNSKLYTSAECTTFYWQLQGLSQKKLSVKVVLDYRGGGGGVKVVLYYPRGGGGSIDRLNA